MINKIKLFFYIFLNPKIKIFNQIKNFKLYIANIGSGSVGEYDFSSFFWTKISDYCKFYCFDPSNQNRIDIGNQIIFPYGLWNEKTTKEIWLTKFSYASSLYEPNYDQLNKFINFDSHLLIGKKKINLEVLDQVTKNENLDYCDFIKIDAEGAELNILNGAKKNLDNALGLEIEINFIEKNINAPNGLEVIDFCKKNYFEIFILNRESWRKNLKININENHQLIWADAVFFKTEQEIYRKLNLLDKKQIFITLNKLIILMLNYRLYDTLKHYLIFFEQKKLINIEDLKYFENILNKNIENNFIQIFKSFFLLSITLICYPLLCLSFSKKVINSTNNFLRILVVRFLNLILNLFRYNGPNKVSISDNFKNL